MGTNLESSVAQLTLTDIVISETVVLGFNGRDISLVLYQGFGKANPKNQLKLENLLFEGQIENRFNDTLNANGSTTFGFACASCTSFAITF